jgi:ribosomal protein L29
MSSLQQLQHRQINDDTRYTHGQLVQLRRQMLRFARSTPPGTERNARRQIARSLRSLFKNKGWLDAHTGEGSK